MTPKGPHIKKVRVRTGRGKEGSPKADIVKEVAWIYSYRSSQNSDKGGSKKPKKFADVLYVWPPTRQNSPTEHASTVLLHFIITTMTE